MNEIAKQFQEKIQARILKGLGIKNMNDMDWSKLSTEEWLGAYELILRCVFGEIKKSSMREFNALMEPEEARATQEAENAGQKLIRYWCQVGDPALIVQYVIPMAAIADVVTDELAEECVINLELMRKMLRISSISNSMYVTLSATMRPFQDLTSLASSILGLDSNWSTAVVCAAMEELLVKKKLDELKVPRKPRDKFDSLSKKLTSALRIRGQTPRLDVLVSPSHWKVRNKILHEGWNPTEDELNRLIAHIVGLSRDLGLESRRPNG